MEKDLWEQEFIKYINGLDWVSPDAYDAAYLAFKAGWNTALELAIKTMEARNG